MTGDPAGALGLLALVSNGMAAGAVAVLLYMAGRCAEDRGRRLRLAEMPSAESTEAADIIKRKGWDRALAGAGGRRPLVPRLVYDGMLASGNVSYFDTGTQSRPYRLCLHESRSEWGGMRNDIGVAICAVEQIKNANRPFRSLAAARLRRLRA